MPHNAQRGAQSRLADVLADIKNSRADDDCDQNNHNIAPTPAKRRSAVNYVALSGHTPRQSRSNSRTASQSNNNSEQNRGTTTPTPAKTPRAKAYALRLFDRFVDLTPYSSLNSDEQGEEEPREVPLYPLCRAWVQGTRTSHNPNTAQQLKTQNQVQTKSPACIKIEKVNGESPSTANHPETNEEMTISTEVHALPPPAPESEIVERFGLDKLIDESEKNIDLRIPKEVRDFKPSKDIEELFDNSINTLSQIECMHQNKQRWKKVKRDWAVTKWIYNKRYEESFKIINEMFKPCSRAG